MNFDIRSHATAVAAVMSRVPPPSLAHHAPAAAAAERKRTRIWDLHSNLHCSIIGTCLSAGELRQILGRTGLHRPDLTDHDLHIEGVRIAGRHDAAGKILSKALDLRHKVSIRRAATARTAEALLLHWQDGLKAGEIPGTYWAVLTHPAATDALIKRAFGDVHMLSHLVGSANRADLKRLCQLEAEKGELEDRVRRQQIHLREAILTRDANIGELRQALVARVAAARSETGLDDDAAPAMEQCIADLQRQLSLQARRFEAVEKRHAQAQRDLENERSGRRAAEQTAAQLTAELQALETSLQPIEDMPAGADLGGINMLYIGGRPHQIPSLRAAIRERNANFLYHDGGIEDSIGLIAGLIARADIVAFPVDCISHDAALSVKRLCRQQGKPFVPLRSSGVTSLMAALANPSLFSRAFVKEAVLF